MGSRELSRKTELGCHQKAAERVLWEMSRLAGAKIPLRGFARAKGDDVVRSHGKERPPAMSGSTSESGLAPETYISRPETPAFGGECGRIVPWIEDNCEL